MASLNPRLTSLGTYGSSFGRSYDIPGHRAPAQDRQNYLHPNRYPLTQTKPTSKSGYKYTFYKDPSSEEYHYHSRDRERDSLAMDTVRESQGVGVGMGMGGRDGFRYGAPSLTHSPSFRRTEQKSREFLDSIDNIIESHRSKYSQSSHQPHNAAITEAESQQILFLKQKLIETHHKLLKQLQTTNKLTFDLETLQAQLQSQQKQSHSLSSQLERMKRQIDILHEQLNRKGEKNQEKYRSLEGRLQDEGKRNGQLKEDLEAMRNKMLETLMVKNNFQEENIGYKSEVGRLEKVLERLKSQLNQKQQNLQYVTKQLDLLRKKYQKCDKECQQRAQQIHQYSHLASQREKALHSLQLQLKSQKQKNSSSVTEFLGLQAEHKAVCRRLGEMEELCEKYKGEIYWHEKNGESNEKAMKEKLERLTEEFNFLNVRYKEKEKQIENLRKKPIYERKKNYEHTKEFVSKLESQQQQISHSRVIGTRNQSKGSGRGTSNSNSKSPKNQSTVRHPSTRSPNPKTSSNPITHEPVTTRYPQSGYKEQKSKYISMLSQVGDLEADLLSYNMEKKKILNEMDKIDDTKVKTKEMISRRRKLEEEATMQDDRIRRVKEELKKMKAL